MRTQPLLPLLPLPPARLLRQPVSPHPQLCQCAAASPLRQLCQVRRGAASIISNATPHHIEVVPYLGALRSRELAEKPVRTALAHLAHPQLPGGLQVNSHVHASHGSSKLCRPWLLGQRPSCTGGKVNAVSKGTLHQAALI